MRFIEFTKRFGDEQSCKTYFKEFREKQGLTCSKCSGKRFTWLPSHDRWQCRSCSKQITLRSGTLLESSNLPYHYWIYAIFLMTNTKKGISAKEMQRQLGHKRYEPVWAMMHKIRKSMGNRDDKYLLDKIVEFDDGFIKTSSEDKQDDSFGKPRGRGTSECSSIVMMASTGTGKVKGKKSTKLRFIKMKVIKDQSSETFAQISKNNIDSSSEVISDGFKGFSKLKNHVAKHVARKTPPDQAEKLLPWVHTTISNLKRTLLGIHHNLKDIYLQNYLNEFCFKVNRRYFEEKLFERMMVAAVEQPWYGKSNQN